MERRVRVWVSVCVGRKEKRKWESKKCAYAWREKDEKYEREKRTSAKIKSKGKRNMKVKWENIEK